MSDDLKERLDVLIRTEQTGSRLLMQLGIDVLARIKDLERPCASCTSDNPCSFGALARIAELEAQFKAATDLISRPYIGAWSDEILIEAAHQRDRFGAEHDTGKAPEDWFWLIGYLAGKALAAHRSGDMTKAHHHTVSTGAVLAHWAAAIDGNEDVFRPGIGGEKLAAFDPKPTATGETP